MPRPEFLFAELGFVLLRVKGGRTNHLVEDPALHLRGSRAICGAYHDWARSGSHSRNCYDCERVAAFRLAPKGNP